MIFGFSCFRNYRVRALLYARQAQMAPAGHQHSPLKSEEPLHPVSRNGSPPERQEGRPKYKCPATLRADTVKEYSKGAPPLRGPFAY